MRRGNRAGRPTPEHGAAPAEQDVGERGGWTGQQTTGAIVAGVGIVAIGVGAVFGVRALGQKSDADSACGGSGGNCTSAGNANVATDDIHTAQDTARVSTIAIGAGVIAAAIGGYLYFTGGGEASPKASVRVAPTVARDGGGIAVGGRF